MTANGVGYSMGINMTLISTTCSNCGIPFAVPTDFDRSRRDSGGSFHCPNGHSLSYKVSAIDKVRERANELVIERNTLANRVEELEQAIRKAAGLPKDFPAKKRPGDRAGRCSICHRQYVFLDTHVNKAHAKEANNE